MAQYDLLAFDLDGTVFDSPMNQTISPRVEQALSAAREAGVVIAANTGRPKWMLGEQLLQAPWLDFAICTCGSSVEALRGKESPAPAQPKSMNEPFQTISNPIALEDAYELVALLAAYDAEIFVHTQKFGIIDSKSTKRFLKIREDLEKKGTPSAQDCFISLLGTNYLKRFEHILDGLEDPSIFSGNPILKVDATLATEELRDEVADKAVELKIAEVARVSKRELEITAHGCSKYSGLIALADALGISAGRTVAFGDSGNDASLLNKDITFVAMANAEQKIKFDADYYTDSVKNDGVAVWTEKYVTA